MTGENEEHGRSCTGCQILGLLAEVDRLKALIKQAPHDPRCANLTPAHYFAKPACNCWKAKALKG